MLIPNICVATEFPGGWLPRLNTERVVTKKVQKSVVTKRVVYRQPVYRLNCENGNCGTVRTYIFPNRHSEWVYFP